MEADHKLGAMLGALVGDAAGATLEFYHGNINASKAQKAMGMPGGGSLNVAPGQVTDDGELTLALMSALSRVNPQDPYPTDLVARSYSDWFKSEPFDCGQTCARAFGSIVLHERSLKTPIPDPGLYMIQKAKQYNMMSEANGAMMRCTPIPAFYHKLPYTTIAGHAKQDAMLSHPSTACQDANAIYAVSIAHLINNPNDVAGCIKRIESWPCSDTAKQWITESTSLENLENYNCKTNMGHVKHAFILALYFLRTRASYEDAIRQTLVLGGDTDTNAAIVGGLMGALCGASAIPEYMKDPVLLFDPSKHTPSTTLLGYIRPKMYCASNVIRFATHKI